MSTVRKIQRYGWVRDIPDHRDVIFRTSCKIVELPPSVDLRPFCPPPYDQGQLGSCTANAIAGAIQFDEEKEFELDASAPSRLFIYYNERLIEGDTSTDGGAQIRDGIKSVASQGYVPESLWSYDNVFSLRPPQSVYSEAAKHTIKSYSSVEQDTYLLKACLAEGYPFVFGFSVFDAFESDEVAKTGIVPMPGANDAPIGGHAVLCVGYDDSKQVFIVRNSWGDSWGQAGYFTIPYAYLTNQSLASDFWQIKVV